MTKELIQAIRDKNNNLVAFFIYDSNTRQVILYSCEKIALEEIDDKLDIKCKYDRENLQNRPT